MPGIERSRTVVALSRTTKIRAKNSLEDLQLTKSASRGRDRQAILAAGLIGSEDSILASAGISLDPDQIQEVLPGSYYSHFKPTRRSRRGGSRGRHA